MQPFKQKREKSEIIMGIKQKLVSGVIWKGLERIFAQVVSTVVSVILARLLVPDDYSVVSIVGIFFAFCNLFISGGMNTALIHKKDADATDYSTILISNTVAAAVLYGLVFFCAPTIAKLYDKPILTPVFRVMAFSFFVNGYKAVLCAKISTDMAFKKFFFATFIGTIISAGLGVFMAMKGMGAWALVAQQLSNSVIDTIVLALTTRLNLNGRFSFERFKELIGYAGRLIAASFIATVYNECNPLIVGIRFTTTDLAFYNKGMAFPKLINTIGSNTLSGTLFPALSKVQNDKNAVLSMTRRYMKTASFIVFPLSAGLMAVSENFVRVLLTEKWLPMVPYMVIFCLPYAFDLIQVGSIQAVKAIGRSDAMLKMEITKKTVYFAIIALFVCFAKQPLALAYTGWLTCLWATLVNTYATRKLIHYRYRQQILDILPNLAASVVMAVCVYCMNFIHLNAFILLPLQIVAGAVIYVGLCIVGKNENLGYLLKTLKETLGRRHKAA